MPHVVIHGPASPEQLFGEFTPISLREHDAIMKVRDVFLNMEKTKALLECVVVEDRISRTFYMTVSKKEDQVTVRLDPLTDPEKTPGIKRLIAIIAGRVKAQHSDCAYGQHNLAGFLDE